MIVNVSTNKCELCLRLLFNKNVFVKYIKRAYLLSPQLRSDDFASAYVPSAVEAGKYEKWQQNASSPSKAAKPFAMIMPPPNITGTLHLGHALTLTIQDVLIRWNRMCGRETMWVPGMDHAGIATQVVVEKKLWQEKKKTRHDIGREKFQQEVWKWKRQKSEVIRQQVKKLGALPHWDMEYFTMDDKQSRAVTEAFIRLFDSGLIYRSDYLVNWSCVLQSAISDVEVEHLAVSGRTSVTVPGYERPVEFGVLTKFAYKLCDADGEVIVSTTRPETVLGDAAVAVHPSDNRYSTLQGKHVLHPFRQEPIPIICDEFVDPTFGTGVVKVTPAHDPVDFEVGKRHNLPTIPVISDRGDIIFKGPEFSGMKRFHARDIIVEKLAALGLLRGREDHSMNVPLCSRSGDVVEYLIRPQWFVSCQQMAEIAAQDVREGRLKIQPEVFEKTWFKWLENIRDWCISRQLWWGHQVPAYRCRGAGAPPEDPHVWVAAPDVATARSKAAAKLQISASDVLAEQDEDVLDTWFSSALLPFAAFGWPDKPDTFDHFYPTSLLETGHDILFFWVARMVMLGRKLTGQLPFQQVLLHGVICDVQGRKMSKSLGNVIAPEDVIHGVSLQELEEQCRAGHAAGLLSSAELERAVAGQRKMFPAGIPQCGADALRFTLLSHNIQSHFINFDVSECYTNKLFCNKIWQACKYTRLSVEKVSKSQNQVLSPPSYSDLSLMDRWILSRLSWMVAEVNEALRKNDFHVATAALKQFFYGDFCDVYVETTKPALRKPECLDAAYHVGTLCRCLDVGLRCLAPFMPHLAEELSKHVPKYSADFQTDSVFPTSYPQKCAWRDEILEEEVGIALETSAVIRRLRKLANVSVKHAPKVQITGNQSTYSKLLDVITTLSGCREVILTPNVTQSGITQTATTTLVSDTVGNYGTVHLLLPRVVTDDTTGNTSNTTKGDNVRLSKKIEKLAVELDKLTRMINAEGYRTKAPANVQQAHSKKLVSLQEELKRLQNLHDL